MTVSVDNDFARFGAKSYAINKITSVEIREVKDKNGGCLVAATAVLTLVFGLVALGSLGNSEFGAGVTFFLLAAFFGWLTSLAVKRSKRLNYQLFLITAASEQQAYESRDPADVYGLRDQVEAAMLHHSRGAH